MNKWHFGEPQVINTLKSNQKPSCKNYGCIKLLLKVCTPALKRQYRHKQGMESVSYSKMNRVAHLSSSNCNMTLSCG